MPESIITRTADLRNPFQIDRLPPAIRLFLHSKYEPAPLPLNFDRVVPRKWSKRIFAAAQKLKVPMAGRLRFENANLGTSHLINFNGRNTQFASLYFSAYKFGYEPWLGSLLDWLVPDDGVFMDVGSNWGYFGLYLASRPKFSGKIFCFEPMPETFADLRDIIEQAGLADTIQYLQVGLSNESGSAKMTLPNGIESGLAQIATDGEHDVTLSKLDDLASERGISRIDFIKVDVEGAEFDVLLGAENSIRAHRPMIVLESWKAREDTERTLAPLNYLDRLGYDFFLPCWSVTGRVGSFFADQETKIDGPKAELSLLPFRWRERLLYDERINVFACCREKLGLLSND